MDGRSDQSKIKKQSGVAGLGGGGRGGSERTFCCVLFPLPCARLCLLVLLSGGCHPAKHLGPPAPLSLSCLPLCVLTADVL